MSALDEPSTINPWFQQAGPINLRRVERHRIPDTHAAEGIIIAALAGVILLELAYLMWRLW